MIAPPSYKRWDKCDGETSGASFSIHASEAAAERHASMFDGSGAASA